jgi:hypothetical protein
MRGRTRAVGVAAVAGALAGLAAAGCNYAWKSPDPPGEWADAAAAGSGYGVGVARQAYIFGGGGTPTTGPSPYDNPAAVILKEHAGDAGAGDGGVRE